MTPTPTATRDIAYQLHPFTNLRKHEAEGPLVITGGHGIYVRDESGREYIEALAGLWCASLGFGEERLVEAAARQMRKLPYYHQFASKAHDTAIDLAERLIELLPVRMSKIFFNNSGSEANDTAVKLVWYYNNALGRHRKKKIISRLRGYHGITVASASLTGILSAHRDFDLPLPQMRHTDCPDYYRYGRPGESEEDFATRMADNLDAQIQREDPETVAAFIAEPVMGAGGVIVPPDSYFPRLRAICDRHEVLLIADEIITGFCRTGTWFGLEHWGVQPDIVAFAKGVTSGYLPLGGILLSEPVHRAILDAPADLRYTHAATYSGHPTCCAVALRNLDILEGERLAEAAAAKGARLLEGLRTLEAYPAVGDVRGLGMMCGVELVEDRATRRPALGLGARVIAEARERGLFTRMRGGAAGEYPIGDTICLAPPLTTSDAEIDRIVAILHDALRAATA